jgi:hypothetical protein
MDCEASMSREDTLRELYAAFQGWPQPNRVTEDVPDDLERQMIERDFGGKSGDDLTYRQCSMLLVDGALVSANAYFFFLPRLARAVLQEGGDWVLLELRLDALGRERLNPQQVEAVYRLQTELDSIEAEMEENDV